ncbi:gp45 sliding clamp DNA polymerase accessory protein [Synechococcus phage metaG-MbCM1]|jgi:hypothetical protein|uniref:Sliding clamp n=1 Tax=Synechococcus phage metaG-MbCM1 TaxID=1079999 RepID=H8ZND3_9CAUD|nr:DNA polymerase processivity factor [Synechococcus phage metaG-MbCM1]AFD02994.1 gp45 sliding clamp DNA polymerase accessory protein [Synechococcus phage metaG-MbCM1]|tara:strand:+ start:4583 stop:5242 length:660 start_codon:yes stop_codon:yes gene_type:complete
MTVITPQTIEVLKNFCAINKSIVIKPGNTISTLSINKNILAIAEVQEQFESEISIYDLGLFVNGLSLFDQPKIDTNSKSFVVVSDEVGRSKTRFFYADPEIITQAPEEEIKLPDMDVHFHLDSETHKQLNKAAAIYQLPDLCLFGDGEEMNLCVTDKKNETSNNFSVKVGNTDQTFCYCFRVENLKLLAGAYDVSVSSKNVAKFQGTGIKYYIALEPNE